MGFLEDIAAMNLSDEDKERLRRAHSAEVDPLKQDNDSLKARNNRSAVETEIKQLAAIGFEDAPGLLAFTRRVFLSPDANEPGAILLSDSEMGLSGDLATGATGREEISAAATLRKFIELMPRNEVEGKLRIQLSEQSNSSEDHDRPDNGDDADKSQGARDRLGAIKGSPVQRSKTRYDINARRQARAAANSGGGS